GHVTVQRVGARLEGIAFPARLGRVGERALARDHALGLQLLAHLGSGFAGADVDHDGARAGARVVRRVQVVVPDVEESAAGRGESTVRAIHGAARRLALLRLGFPPRGRLGGALRSRAGAPPRPRPLRKSPSSLNPGRRPESSSPQAWPSSASSSSYQPPLSPY